MTPETAPSSSTTRAFAPTTEQAALLEHRPGRHARVLAGPGTGKSATLVALVTQLLGSEPSPRVRLLTFTRAATGELAKKVSQHPAAAAQRPSTVHSFALSVLVRNPGAGDLPSPLRIADDLEFAEIIRPTLARRVGVPQRQLDRLVREMAASWESLRQGEDPRVTPDERRRFLGAWHEHRRAYGYTMLPELPYALRHALQTHPELTGVSFDLIIVDEYQDLNACDLAVLRLLAERGCSIIAAGDDDQSIYSGRMAAPEGIRRFLTDYPGAADYSLSITQRCGARIIDWASAVIEADPDRPRDRPRLSVAAGSPPGEVALLSFRNQDAEALGVAKLVSSLVSNEGVPPEEILILLRSDHNEAFSTPIKQRLSEAGIPCADPGTVDRILALPESRRLLALLRLLCDPDDSLSWATLFHLAHGIGDSFCDQVYDYARTNGQTFGSAVLAGRENGFSFAPTRSARTALQLTADVYSWLDGHELPEQPPEGGWGQWIIAQADGVSLPIPSTDLSDLLLGVDALLEAGQDLSRYLGQVRPLGKDRALATSSGVRVMNLAGSKGLTCRAAILAAVEEGIVPRPERDISEERRLLYVGMTRAKEYLYLTWARRRTGPTARAGTPRVAQTRSYSTFLRDAGVDSEDGASYLDRRWGAPQTGPDRTTP